MRTSARSLSPEAKQAAVKSAMEELCRIGNKRPIKEILESLYDTATAKLRELREGDNKLIRALAEDAGIKITAPDHMLGLQWEQFHDGVMKLRKELDRMTRLSNELYVALREGKPIPHADSLRLSEEVAALVRQRDELRQQLAHQQPSAKVEDWQDDPAKVAANKAFSGEVNAIKSGEPTATTHEAFYTCNKCGYAGANSEHSGCNYLATLAAATTLKENK